MRRLLLLLAVLALPLGQASAAPRPGFGWPLSGTPTVDRGFSPPQTAYGAGHRGVDLRAAVGQPVLAAGAGRVTYAGLLAGRGVVTVTHDGGLRTTYEPVTPTVHVGQAVSRGSALGLLTAGHASCRAGTTCLHWGLLRGQTYLDPLELVSPGPARLLPVEAARPLVVAQPAGAGSATARSVGAVTAAGALVAGLGLLVRRPGGPSEPSPPAPVDLRLERRRRRVA